jgi:integrase
VQRLALAMPAPYDTLVFVLAYTGMRIGEAAALRRGRCDLARARLLVAESLAEVNGELFFGDTKSHRERNVAIPAFLVDRLTHHLAEHVSDSSDALIFLGPGGGPLRYSNFRTRFWFPALERAGLAGLRIHDLRHTYASLAARDGASIKTVQAQLGHQDPALTLRCYQHLFPDDIDALAKRMNDTYAEAASEPPRPERGLAIVPSVSSDDDEHSHLAFSMRPRHDSNVRRTV